MAKISDMTAREAATDEGILGEDVRQLPVKRWPMWARIRYAGDQPGSGVDEIAEPLTTDEAAS